MPSRRNADEATLRAALSFSGALGFVEALPGGIDAELSEGGRSLSGGQRQRLSIARAVVRNPKLALFDEPTAFLDAEAAVALEKGLAVWGRDRLLILVSHHLAATRSANRILVLEAGHLVGDGAHEQLVKTVPEYASLWSDYSRSLEGASL
jgi:ABC-type multidrug transport system fused ATPase/permease subunit